MTNYEKTVKRATKIKIAAPKSKYIEYILTATHSGEAGVAEIFRTLQNRLRDSTWTIVFKSLIVVHLMIREGSEDVTLSFLAEAPHKLAISSFSEVQSQGSNIQRYSNYLMARSKCFADTKVDYVRSGPGRLKRLSVDKGLLRETENVQKQIRALLKCDLLSNEPENEISLTAFRLLTMDLLVLYSVMNEGTINVLEHYFEMSRPDSERALKIYKTFSAQTEEVVKFLGVARHFESATRLEIPKLKHASTDLATLLEDDLNDPDFDLRRKEYLAQKGATTNGQRKDGGPPKLAPKLKNKDSNDTNKAAPKQTPDAAPKVESKPPAPDLIDFFDSIEQNQQPMNQQPQPQQFNNFNPQVPQFQQQQTGFAPQQTGFQQPQQTGFQQPQQTGFQQPQQTGFQQPQQTGFQQPQQTGFQQQADFQQPQQTGFSQNSAFGNPFAQPQQQQQLQPLQPTSTGAGFGAYSSTSSSHGFQSNLPSIPQNGPASYTQQRPHTGHQPQTGNPFRQSMLPPADPTSPPQSAPGDGHTKSLNRQSTNPFAKQSTQSPQFTGGPSPFSSAPPLPQQQTQSQPSTPAPLQPQRTGTNPFARNSVAPQQLQPPPASPLRPNPTGSTNPFRQSMFINQQTGQGWQTSGQQGTMGGYETLDTAPVFPRPGQMA